MANERSSVPILFPPPHSAAYGVTVLDGAHRRGVTLAAPLDRAHPLPELHDDEPEGVKADRRRRMDNRNRRAEAAILRNEPPYWRNGAWLDMAELVNALTDRGFIIDGYPWDNLPALVNTSTPVQPFTNNTITVDAVSTKYGVTALLWVSHERERPYTLTLICTETAEPLITGHTTTTQGALRTVDAFLAGTRYAAKMAEALPYLRQAIEDAAKTIADIAQVARFTGRETSSHSARAALIALVDGLAQAVALSNKR